MFFGVIGHSIVVTAVTANRLRGVVGWIAVGWSGWAGMPTWGGWNGCDDQCAVGVADGGWG